MSAPSPRGAGGPSRLRGTFEALSVHNFRLYFTGQIISVSGTWMQSVAQAWLVLKLTGSGVALGTVTAVQWLPMLLLGAWGGLVADRVDKRRLLIATQTASAVLALILGLLTQLGAVRLWMVFALAAGLGLVNTVDNPSRQSFVVEMVGRDRLTNAVTLNSVVMNAARVVGPGLAGVLIATVGLAICFLANAASFLAVIACLVMMRRADLRPAEPVGRSRGQIVEALRYVRARTALLTPLLLVLVIGTLAYNFNVTLALLARNTFHGGAGAFALLSSLMGSGAVVGGLVAASRGAPTGRRLAAVSLSFGVLVLACAVMPNLPAEMVAVFAMGALSIAFIATANTTLQLASAPEMRGRVMSLYAVAFLGTTPIGSPLVGWVSQAFGARAGIGLGGAAAVVAALAAWPSLTGGGMRLRRSLRRPAVVAPAPEDAVAAL